MPGYYNYGKPFAALLLWRRYKTKTYVTDFAMMREKMFFFFIVNAVSHRILHLEDLERQAKLALRTNRLNPKFRYL